MYEIFADTITQGRFDLTALTRKIARYHIEGLLTDEQRDMLMTSAREAADPHQSYGTWQATADGIMQAIHSLTERITALEAGAPVQPEEAEEWPLFVQPTGAHDAYPMGAKITFEGKRYTSLLAGNAYSPSVYPRGWQVQP